MIAFCIIILTEQSCRIQEYLHGETRGQCGRSMIRFFAVIHIKKMKKNHQHHQDAADAVKDSKPSVMFFAQRKNYLGFDYTV